MPIVYTFAALLGLAVGSFLNVIIARIPTRMSLISPASQCPRCGHAIRARHNVPVLGWLVLRGRCHDCALRISAQYPLVELATAELFVLAVVSVAATHQPLPAVAVHVGLIAALIAVLGIRLQQRSVAPLAPAALAGVAYAGYLGATVPLAGLATAVAAFAAVTALVALVGRDRAPVLAISNGASQ